MVQKKKEKKIEEKKCKFCGQNPDGPDGPLLANVSVFDQVPKLAERKINIPLELTITLGPPRESAETKSGWTKSIPLKVEKK